MYVFLFVCKQAGLDVNYQFVYYVTVRMNFWFLCKQTTLDTYNLTYLDRSYVNK